MSQPDGPAAYSLYDLLRTLAERVSWPTEEEKRRALASVDAAEGMRIFGDLANAMVCSHPGEARTAGGRCDDCGRQIENTQWQNSPGKDRFIRDWGRY